MKWTTKEGEEIPYKKIKNDHLLNILKWIEKRAVEGITLQHGGGGWDIDDMWFEEETLSGKAVENYYDYKGLLKEAEKRNLIKLTKVYEIL